MITSKSMSGGNGGDGGVQVSYVSIGGGVEIMV